MRHGGIRSYALAAAAALLALTVSCGPVISKQVMTQVDPNITFPELLKNPERYKGKTVVFGGRIIETSVKPRETWMEILQLPLEYRQKPEDTDISQGRFLVVFPDYRDPAIYSPGRSMTVAGQVVGSEARKIGQVDYVYPVLSAKEAHLWKVEDYYYSQPGFTFGLGVGIFR